MAIRTRLTRTRTPDTSRTCKTTGLALRSAKGEVVFRIAKPSYGSMNPPVRATDRVRAEWGRFDVAGQQTIYGGHPEEVAYAESLATFRVAGDIQFTKVGDLFDGESRSAAKKTLAEEIESEWQDRNHMPVGKMPAGWRDERLMYRITLPRRAGSLISVTRTVLRQ